jgi:cytoskeleton protein RodZ
LETQHLEQDLQDIMVTREEGFGHQFKIARDAIDVSIDEVATRLHLDKAIIVALESEDHRKLPEIAFVCGYIRNYARLLKLSPEPLIEYYKKSRHADNLEAEIKTKKKYKSKSRHSVFSEILIAFIMPAIFLVIFLALMMALWQGWLYVSEHYMGDETSYNEDSQSDTINNESSFQDDQMNLLLPDLNGSDQAPSEEVLDKKINQSIKNNSTQVTVIDHSLTVTQNSLLKTDSISVEVSSDIAPVTINQPVKQTQKRNQPVTINQGITALNNRLVLEFFGDSWIRIKDAQGNSLASGLKKSSKILKLQGVMPYDVFLGDARMVKVSLNGKTFNHLNYINKKNVARFTVK